MNINPDTSRKAGPGYWFAGQVLTWIAYGSEPLPITPMHPIWAYDPPKILLEVLAARAERKPWRPSEPLNWGEPYHYRARAKRIEREMGLPAADALRSLLETQRLSADMNRRLDEALSELNIAVATGSIVAEGRPTNIKSKEVDYKAYEMIPRHLIDGLRTIDASGWLCISTSLPSWEWLRDDGPFFHDTRFEIMHVLRQWPDRAKPKAPQQVLAWMISVAEAFVSKGQGKPKRDVLIKDCVSAMGCRYEDAEEAHGELPDHLRRRRGERQPPAKSAG